MRLIPKLLFLYLILFAFNLSGNNYKILRVILKEWHKTMTHGDIATALNMSQSTIQAFISGKRECSPFLLKNFKKPLISL